MESKKIAKVEQVNMKLEVVMIGVSDVDRAKAFYENLGWRLDADFAAGGFRVVQLTPHNSPTSIIFGKGIASPKPGVMDSLVLVVSDIAAAHSELKARGVDISDVYHYTAGPFNEAVENARAAGRDAEARSYYSFLSFKDPDGNGWLLQEIQTRLPGREWASTQGLDIPKIAELLHETEQHHGAYESTHAQHNWWDWYAAYFSSRRNGDTSEQASAAADRYMDEVFHVPPR
ncbi:MAG TPA: VOC family protein [Blastocatellia bacterium]|nr:VOC family protein [Blastocatellia bacterium]